MFCKPGVGRNGCRPRPWTSGLLGALLQVGLLGCAADISDEHYQEMRAGMSETELVRTLGAADETQMLRKGDIEYKKMTWRSDTHTLAVTLENGQLKYKTYRENP